MTNIRFLIFTFCKTAIDFDYRLRRAGIGESALGVPAHPEGPLSRLLRSSRQLEVEVKEWRETDTAASFGRKERNGINW